ncbi:hypothetical protein KS527_004467 [Salmonella enterica]|nr:hypothetical protein [Salmonella enterica]
MAQRTLEPRVFAFINRYRDLCGERPTIEQQLLIQYFLEAGNALPIDNGPDWFFCAWRKCEVIESRGMGSKDMVVWNLIGMDGPIQQVVKEMCPQEDAEVDNDF